ncbi:hypothetical protein PENTCL1PPCAC_16581 [Pristionchus entomophagus]|uniref:START domain-containing protein n=1 Tax=Pristionchus entomophagus TaxID=358040 RepID=A0AAV5TJD5_9BILA|nr:hypothetical protein PENTCL1PPCAC_16581 [Pristionchus entomophagus]
MVATINISPNDDKLPAKCAKYSEAFTTAKVAMEQAIEMLNASDFDSKASWKLDCKSDEATVHYKDLPDGRYFAGRTKLGISAKDAINHFYNDVETAHEWNENIKSGKKLHKLTDNIDIVKMSNNDILIIKSRDFLAARCIREYKEGCWILAARSVELEEMPETKDAVRAFVHLGMSRAVPDPEDPEHSCIFDNVANMDLKGMLFRSVVNQVTGRIVLKDLEIIRNHCTNVLRKKLYTNV